MENFKVDLKDKGIIKLVTIRYQDEIKVSMRELKKSGLIKDEDSLFTSPDKTLRSIVEQFKVNKIPGIKKDRGGGKHANHNLYQYIKEESRLE